MPRQRAAAFAEDRAGALEAGCTAHLAKPVLREDLLKTLGGLLPVAWTRAGDDRPPADPAPAPPPEALPAAARERLLHLARQGDVGAVAELARDLAATGGCPGRAGRLAELAEGFDIAGLRALAARLGRGAAD